MSRKVQLIIAGLATACGAGLIAYATVPKYLKVSACEKAVSSQLVAPATAKFSDGTILTESLTESFLQSWFNEASKANDHALGNQLLASQPNDYKIKKDLEDTKAELDKSTEAYRLYKFSPYQLTQVVVDSQNRASAFIRSKAGCAVLSDNSASVLWIGGR